MPGRGDHSACPGCPGQSSGDRQVESESALPHSHDVVATGPAVTIGLPTVHDPVQTTTASFPMPGQFTDRTSALFQPAGCRAGRADFRRSPGAIRVDRGGRHWRAAWIVVCCAAIISLGGCYQRRYEPANWQSPAGRRGAIGGLQGDGTTLPAGTTLPYGTTLPMGTTPMGTTLPAWGADEPATLPLRNDDSGAAPFDGTTLPGPVR